MVTVNIDEARAHLSKLVDRAARGEAFVIAKAGQAQGPPCPPPGAGLVRTEPARGEGCPSPPRALAETTPPGIPR